MSSVKLVLRKKENKDGLFPLAIRITKDRQTSFIHVGRSIKKDDWDDRERLVKTTHKNSKQLNNFLKNKLVEADNWSLDLEKNKPEISSRAIRQKIKPNTGTTFFPQAENYLEHLKKAGKYNQYTSDKPRINHFKDFLNGAQITFSDITVPKLDDFIIYLRGRVKSETTQAKLSERTIINHLVTIRSVFSFAIKTGVIDRKQYPFGKDKIVIKFPDSAKIGLIPEEVKQLEDLELPLHSTEHHARNLWLFSFYLAGMRVSDVLRLKWTDINDNRLYYTMGKNDKGGSLKLPEKALSILEYYQSQKRTKDDFIFPELKGLDKNANDFIVQRTIAFATSRIDKFLREKVAPRANIEKKLTMHIARHTFGNISGDKISIQMLQKLYRHSHVTTTIGYQANFIHKDTDSALDSVINF